MALPTVFLKAKGAIKKGATAYKAGKQAKSLTDGEELTSSLFNKIKLPIAIGGFFFTIAAFFLIIIVAIPFILANEAFGSENGQGNGGGSSASEIVNCAREQMGKAYVWGAIGPNNFDCSGLVYYCYQNTFNMTIGRDTYAQVNDSNFTTVSSLDELGAGGIILCDRGGNVHHVGIYSGEQTVIHAPHTGDVVKEVPMDKFCGGQTLIYRNFNGK